MLELWSVIALMLVFTSALLVWPLVKYKGSHQQVDVSQKQENILIFQERLSELDSEKAQGNLTEDAFLHLKTELEKSLLGDVQEQELTATVPLDKANSLHWVIMGLVSSVFVVASLLTYQHLGASEQYAEYLALGGEKAVLASSSEPQNAAPDFAKAVTLLKAKLAKNPEDIEKWFLLANSYAAMGNFTQTANVFKKISELVGQESPDYPAIKAAYAQATYQVAGEKITPEVQQAINEALSLDAQEPTALILQGLGAYTNKHYTQAIAFWEKAKVKAGETQITRFIEPAIQEARRQSGKVAVKVQPSKTELPVAGVGVTVKLSISAELKAKVKPNERVFVFAKGNRPMPLAAERLQVKDLPVTLVLDDSKAAMPTAKISSVAFVDITARIALSGSPRAVKGDFYATAKQVAVKQGAEVILVINQVVK